MHLYKQSTGEWFHDGTLLTVAYSGNEKGLNNPAWQRVKGHGPVPEGNFTLSSAFTHPHLGPCVMRFIPAPDTEMFGRSGIDLHGDNSQRNHTGSDGCVVMEHGPRQQVADWVAASDDQVQVIP